MTHPKWKGSSFLVLMEFLTLNFSLFIVLLVPIQSSVPTDGLSFTYNSFPLFIWFNLSWALIILLTRGVTRFRERRFRKRVKYLVIHSLLLIGVVSTIYNILPEDYFHGFPFLLAVCLFDALYIIFLKFIFPNYQKQQEHTVNAKVLIVEGSKKRTSVPEFAETVEHQGYEVIGYLNGDTRQEQQPPFSITGKVGDLSAILESNPIDEIFLSLPTLKKSEIQHVVKTADYHGVRVNLVPVVSDLLPEMVKPAPIEELPIYKLRKSPLDQIDNAIIKLLFDFFFALFVIICLAPVFLMIALFIYLDNPGPIFYLPLRKGEKGKSFRCYKFRTMSVCDDPIAGTRSTEKNDPRITRVGRFLRKNDLDELPQFLNVLKGEMSVVGPRPHRVFLENDFRKIVNEYMVRHYVKPGITGWAQVNGWRGPTKTVAQKKERVQHDLWYIENWSLWLDIKIIFLTVFGKKTRKNAF